MLLGLKKDIVEIMAGNSLFYKPFIMCHTLILWPWAYANYTQDREDYLSAFYLRQTLGIILMMMLVLLLPNLRSILIGIPIISWVISIIGAMREVRLIIPFIGIFFQRWFKTL